MPMQYDLQNSFARFSMFLITVAAITLMLLAVYLWA
jgi:hypothetical protein